MFTHVRSESATKFKQTRIPGILYPGWRGGGLLPVPFFITVFLHNFFVLVSCNISFFSIQSSSFLTGASSPSSPCDIELWSRKEGDNEVLEEEGHDGFQYKRPALLVLKS